MEFDDFTFDIKQFARGITVRFKGGGGGAPTSTLPDTENRKYAREQLYPLIRAGMLGEGYGGAAFTRGRSQQMSSGLEEAYNEAQSGLKSQMHRTLDPTDARTRDYMTNALQRNYITTKDNIARGERAEKTRDIDLSQAFASEYLAGEKRMTVSAAGAYNQALQADVMADQQYGTGASQFAAGLGSGMADYYYAQKMGQ